MQKRRLEAIILTIGLGHRRGAGQSRRDSNVEGGTERVRAMHIGEDGDAGEDAVGACRILIVEDDPLVSTHIESIIETTVGAEVVVSQSVAEANAALAQPFDFAFLDVDVLDGTTYAFAATLLAAGIGFAFVSASKRELMPSDLKHAPFIPKPYADADIAGMVRSAVRPA